MSVDAWIGIALSVVKAQSAGLDVASGRLRDAIERTPVVLAANPKIAGWQRYLLEADGPAIRDELPAVVLWGEEAQTTTATLDNLHTLDRPGWDLGRLCEVRAAGKGHGLTNYMRALCA